MLRLKFEYDLKKKTNAALCCAEVELSFMQKCVFYDLSTNSSKFLTAN